ncbi:MAG: nuclear transport factor 2 family protein [Gammaproteobacteria bacterium]|nr:nuclear transport factor 2 family protein [Gammaproteobacteria bacterium]
MQKLIATILAASLVIVTGCATSPPDASVAEGDKQVLMELNERLARSQIVERDPSFLAEVALEQLRVLAPGGLIEGKQQVIAGLSGWDAVDVTLSKTEIAFYQNIAIVSGRMDIDGTMHPVGRWGPLKYMSTWVKDEGRWRLLSRSLTPCLDKLIEMGRC